MTYKHWTDGDYKLLDELWGTMKTSDIAKIMGRSLSSVNHAIRRMGKKMTDEQYERATGKTRWTEQMDDLMRKEYNRIGAEQIANRLNIESIGAVRKRAVYLEITADYIEWTPERDVYLREKWGEVALSTIAKTIGTTEEGVRQRAYKIGLSNQLESSGDYFSVNTVSEILGINIRTLHGYVKDGIIKTRNIKIGDTQYRRIKYDEMIKFMMKHPDKYNTLDGDINSIKGFISQYSMNTDTNFRIKELPDWLIRKIEKDQQTGRKVQRRNWTTQEEVYTIRRIKEGATVGMLMGELGRTEGSVRGKLKTLKKEGRI